MNKRLLTKLATGIFCLFFIMPLLVMASQNKKQEMASALSEYYLDNFSAAIPVFEIYAEKNDAEAQYFLALSLVRNTKDKELTDFGRAGYWLTKAADNGNPYAMYQLSQPNKPSWFGLASQNSKLWEEKAILRWSELSEKGDADAMAYLASRSLGWLFYIPYYGKYRERQHLNKAIETGSNFAASLLPVRLRRGSPSAETREEVVKYLRIAAKNGYAPSMNELARQYKYIDDDEAYKWASEALKLGYQRAVSTLTKFYREGIGTERSPKNAYKIYLIEHGWYGFEQEMSIYKQRDLAKLELEMTKDEIHQAKVEAKAFVEKYPRRGYGNPLDW